MKKTYSMNGTEYTNLTAIAKELGLSRVRPSQFAKYGITEVTEVTSNDTTTIPATAPVTEAAAPADNTTDAATDTTDEPDKKDEPKAADKPKQSKAKAEKQPKEPTLAETITEAKAISEDISKTVTLEDFSKALRKVPLDILETCATTAGVDVPAYDSAPIQRMHLTLNLREHFYPGQKVEPKKASLFRKVPLDILVTKADEMGLSYRVNDASPDAIVRMWVTKALADAGVKAEDLMPQPDLTSAADPDAAAFAADQGDANED